MADFLEILNVGLNSKCSKLTCFSTFSKKYKFTNFKSPKSICEYLTISGNLENLKKLFELHIECRLQYDWDGILVNAVQHDHLHIAKYLIEISHDIKYDIHSSRECRIFQDNFIPVYHVKSIEMLELLLCENLLNFNSLSTVQCKKKFRLFQRLCLLPRSFWTNYPEVRFLMQELKESVQELLPELIHSHELLKSNRCYFKIKSEISQFIPIQDLTKIVLDFMSMDRFVSKKRNVRGSRMLA